MNSTMRLLFSGRRYGLSDGFIFLQFQGFSELIATDITLQEVTSTVTTSFIYIVVGLRI